MTQHENIAAYELVDLGAIIRRHRMTICERYYQGGDLAALETVSMSALTLYRYVFDGSLIEEKAFEPLLDVSVNLGLVKRLGPDHVHFAIMHGRHFHCELARAA